MTMPVVEEPKPEVVPKPVESASPNTSTDSPTPSKKETKQITLSESTLRERLERASRSTLKKIFGTEDPKEAMKMASRLKELETAKKNDDLAKMDEVTRLKTQMEDERKKRLDIEKRLRTEQRTSAIRGEENRVKGVFSEFIEEKYFPHVARDLADHILNKKKMSKEQISKLTPAHLKKWLSGYLKNNPAFKKNVESKEVVPREPANNGKSDVKPKPVTNPEKDIRPGKANSMSAKEFQDWKRQNGYNF